MEIKYTKLQDNGSTVEKWFDVDNNVDGDIRPAGIAFDERDNLYLFVMKQVKMIVMVTPEKVHGILAGNNDDKSIDNVMHYNGSLFSPRSISRDKYGDISCFRSRRRQ